jgi:hypothetical protein
MDTFQLYDQLTSKPIKDFDDLLNRLASLNKVEATKALTLFFASARFKLDVHEFDEHFTDGPNDGGIDFYYFKDKSFYIFQTKFSEIPKRASESELRNEISKLKSTLLGNNNNPRLEHFLNLISYNKGDKESRLYIFWLTTNEVGGNIVDEISGDLDEWRKENNWSMPIKFILVDKDTLDRVIFDVNHGYIPYTGRRELSLEDGQWLDTKLGSDNIRVVIANIKINEILSWFREPKEINDLLQRNVREFLGKSGKVNRAIAKSYIQDPDWFWFKHNGIIMFADKIDVDTNSSKLVLMNPQVVNGGQTLRALFPHYTKRFEKTGSARVLLRVYEFPYEGIKTYRRSIEVIAALNSQNQIKPSDLRSADPRQVRLEQLFKRLGYDYIRKRTEEQKPGENKLEMRHLALRFYVCDQDLPHEGVRGNIERLFEDDKVYDKVFKENLILEKLNDNHIVIRYLTCWKLDYLLRRRVRNKLSKSVKTNFRYVVWFVLNDLYHKAIDWRDEKQISLDDWKNFMDSEYFIESVRRYTKSIFRIGAEMASRQADPQRYFKTRESKDEFNSKTFKPKFYKLFNKEINRAFEKYKKERMRAM